MNAIYIVLIGISFVGVLFIYYYNSFIKLRNNVREAWSDIQVQMKRRYDLIPNLVEIVKGYAKHEQDTLKKVIQARNNAFKNQGTPQEQANAEKALSSTLKSIFALSENYPDLKANQNFLELQREITDTEDKMQASRRFYNMNVRELNIKVESVPSNIIAKMFGFQKNEYFELDESETINAKKPVAVNF